MLIILSLFAIFVITTFLPKYIIDHKAYADGLSVENLPPTTIGNRQLNLYVKVNPPILTTAASHSPYMQFIIEESVVTISGTINSPFYNSIRVCKILRIFVRQPAHFFDF